MIVVTINPTQPQTLRVALALLLTDLVFLTWKNSCFTIHSTIAEEHGAQQACNSTLPSSFSKSPSGKTIAGLFILVAKLRKNG